MTSGQDTWSARCVETCTAGAAGGPGKPTRSNPGRAPRSDPTGATTLVLHVWDASPQMPAVQDVAADDDHGRGLFLVETLSKDWGSYHKAGGKVVWVMITVDP
jgi:hypothetical protein